MKLYVLFFFYLRIEMLNNIVAMRVKEAMRGQNKQLSPPRFRPPSPEAYVGGGERGRRIRLLRLPKNVLRRGLHVQDIRLSSRRPSLLSSATCSPATTARFVCNACDQDGDAFSFHCPHCQFDLHLPCAALPKKLHHQSHLHPLTLV